MRIAMIVGTFPALSETFVLAQVRALADRGHRVDVFANRRDRSVDDDPASPLAASVRAYHAGHPREWLALRPLRVAARFLAGAPYDIVHCQFGHLGRRFRGLRPSGLARALVTSFRGWDLSAYLAARPPGVYRRLFATGDAFLASGDRIRARLVDLGCDPAKVVVLGAGVDLERFTFAARRAPLDGAVRLASVGRLVEKKGLEVGIRAVARIDRPELDYRIVGDGPLRPGLERLIADLGVGRRVRLEGAMAHREVAELLARSHLFVAPNVTAGDGDEDGIPNVLKEAMASGLPVVATGAGGIPELVEDVVSGILVAERDVEALSAAIGRLAAAPELWPAMGEAGRRAIEERFDRARVDDRLIEVYEAALASARAGA